MKAAHGGESDEIEVDGELVHREEDRTGAPAARQVLREKAGDTDDHGNERSLLVTDPHDHVAGRNTHEEVGQEVHHVTHHAESVRPLVGVAPDGADRRCKVGHERNHRKEEEHGDHRNDGQLVTVVLFHKFIV